MLDIGHCWQKNSTRGDDFWGKLSDNIIIALNKRKRQCTQGGQGTRFPEGCFLIILSWVDLTWVPDAHLAILSLLLLNRKK